MSKIIKIYHDDIFTFLFDYCTFEKIIETDDIIELKYYSCKIKHDIKDNKCIMKSGMYIDHVNIKIYNDRESIDFDFIVNKNFSNCKLKLSHNDIDCITKSQYKIHKELRKFYYFTGLNYYVN